MPRPAKAGVEYFPLDVDNDDKLDLIEAEFGLTGFAVVVKLYQRIYKFGYYCEWNEEVALLFAKRIGVGSSAVSEILSAAMRRSLFDKKIYDAYGVLTSKGIQQRYFDIVARRKKVDVEQRYLLVSSALIPENVYIVHTETQVNDDMMYAETPINACRSTQSKVKESKGKKRLPIQGETDPPNGGGGGRASLDDYIQQNLFRLSTGNWESLRSLMADGITDEMVRYAVDLATGSGKRTWGYTQGILNNWLIRGYRSLEDVKNSESDRRNGKSDGNGQHREWDWGDS